MHIDREDRTGSDIYIGKEGKSAERKFKITTRYYTADYPTYQRD